MKTTCRVLAPWILATALMADPLFCCGLPGPEAGTRFSAPAMDCCSDDEMGGCSPNLQERSGTLPAPLAAAALASAPATPPATVWRSLPSASFLCPAPPTVERRPRLHLQHSQLLI